jgi:small-conductance mechanosensitive channel
MTTIRRILLHDPMALVWPAVIFVIAFAVGWLIRSLVLRALGAWTRRTQSRPGLILVESLRGPALIWAAILALHLAVQWSELPVRVTDFSSKLLLILWIASLTLMSTRMAGKLVRHYGGQVPGAMPVTSLTENLAQLAVILLGILVLLRGLGLEVTPILTALGVGGLAVALALQDTLSNLFAGFYIAVARQIRLGDYIKLNTGEEGYVTDITWRSTGIRTLGGNLVIIPNSKLSQANVTNYYLPEKRMGSSLQISVTYDADPERIERVLLEIAAAAAPEVPGMVTEPAPSVTFDPGFGEWSLGFTLNYQIAEFANQFGVRNELRKRIYRRFKQEGIVLPYPARVVYVSGADDLKPKGSAAHQ